MAIRTIPLSHLETQLSQTLHECAVSGEIVVVEMPNHQLLTIQALDPTADDGLIDDLLANNPQFQALVEKSKASPRRQFTSQATGKSAR
ncbi:MAG: hypothetical protein K1X57_17060 [Gemmataceae bacterium]|nr:hypothetical protein [Gemmataceae bacterium]